MIIGITGTNGAGKGEVVKYLVEQKGFTHYSASEFLAEELIRRGREKDRPQLRLLGNEFREQYGNGYLVRVFLEKAAQSDAENTIIESVRNTGEVAELKAAGGVLLVVDADRKVRYDRITSRGSEKDNVDFDTFVAQEEREWHGSAGVHDMNIMDVIKMADYTIMNNGTLEELHAQVDAMLEKMA